MYDRYSLTSCTAGWRSLNTPSVVNNFEFDVGDLNLLRAFGFNVTVVGHRRNRL